MVDVTGTSGSDSLMGTEEDDYLSGLDGFDTLKGGGGNDTLDGGRGSDLLEGGDGDDLLIIDSNFDYASGGDGNDTLSAEGAETGVRFGGFYTAGDIENLIGSAFNDSVTASDISENINTGNGNDTISGVLAGDTVDAGSGDDLVSFFNNHFSDSALDALVSLGQGADTIQSFGAENLNGVTVADFQGGDIIQINGSSDLDFSYADSGADLIVTVNGTAFTLNGLAGRTLSFFAEHVGRNNPDYLLVLVPTVFDETTSANDDFIFAGNAGSFIDGLGGNDTILGGEGDDSLIGGDGIDNLQGGPGNDTLDSAEILFGGDGDDLLIYREGSATFDGGEGFDTVSFEHATSGVITGTHSWPRTVFLRSGIEEIIGSSFSDNFFLNSGVTLVRSGAGDDTISGVTSGDTVDAGAGDDFIVVDTQPSGDPILLTLGTGNDTISARFDQDINNLVIDDFQLRDALQISFAHENSISTFDRGDDLVLLIGENEAIFSGLAGRELLFLDNAGNAALTIHLKPTILNSASTEDSDLIVNSDEGVVSDGLAGSDTIIGGEGNDSIQGGEGADFLRGGDGADTLNAGLDDDTLDGGNGNDLLLGGAGNDIFIGGDGDDTVSFINATEGIVLGYQGQTIADDIEHIIGSGHDDRLSSGAAGATINAGAGNDTLSVGSTDQIINAGAGDDFIFAGISSNLTLGEGNDTINVLTGYDLRNTTVSDFATGDRLQFFRPDEGDISVEDIDGGLVVTYFNHTVTLVGLAGARTALIPSLGDGLNLELVLVPAPGNTGSDGDDVLVATGSGSLLEGMAGDDLLFGDDGDDTLDTGDGIDQVIAGAGNDFIRSSAGNDSIDGGTGNDTLDFGGRDAPVSLLGSYYLQSRIIVENIEHLIGSDFDDRLEINSLNATIEGGAGNDSINGTEGEDSLNGQDGDDSIGGAAGNDTLLGAGGDDFLAGGDDNDSLLGGDGWDSLRGELGNDTLTGGTGRDNLYGGDGSDSLLGDDDDDSLSGEGGNDTLLGGTGRDNLSGGDGNDVLTGGNENDTYIGGSGSDTINTGDGDNFISFSQNRAGIDHDIISLGSGSNSLAAWDPSQLDGTRIAGFDQNDQIRISAANGTIRTSNSGNNLHVEIDGYSFILEGLAGRVLTAYMPSIYSNSIYISLVADESGSGTPGSDFIQILPGDGLVDGREGDDTIIGTFGQDSIIGGAGIDNLQGAGGNDQLTGGADNDYLHGGTGNDTLDGGLGSDTLRGADGNDLFLFSSGQDSINGGDGLDTLSAAGFDQGVFVSSSRISEINSVRVENVEFITGSAFNDQFFTYQGLQSIQAGAGNDLISLGTIGTGELLSVTLGAGDDTISGASRLLPDSLTITDFDTGDFFALTGVRLEDVTIAQVGSDIHVQIGDDLVTFANLANQNLQFFATGNSSFAASLGSLPTVATESDDLILLGNADDSFNGLGGRDTIVGGAGNDTLDGGEGFDQLVGGAGDDLLFSDGMDAIIGGDGNDTVNFENATVGQILTLDFSTLPIGFATVLNGIENVIGSDFFDQIFGSDQANQLFGGAGDDVIYGFGGADTIDGEAGDDAIVVTQTATDIANSTGATVDVGLGNDTIIGTFSSDLNNLTVLNFAPGDSLKVNLDTFDDVQTMDDGINLIVTTEDASITLVGLAGAELVSYRVPVGWFGTMLEIVPADTTTTSEDANFIILDAPSSINTLAGNDTILGSAGDDTVDGDAGGDAIEGLAGNDSLAGGEGDDGIYGGDGNDTLIGGDGNDSLFGEAGNDTFIVGPGIDTISGGSGFDTVSFATATAGITVSRFISPFNPFDHVVSNDVEHIIGSGFDDSISGLYSADMIVGGDGNDTIYGWGGADTLDAGNGNDLVTVRQLYNDRGTDIGATVTLGDGADTLRADYEEDLTNLTILDFSEEDIIQFGGFYPTLEQSVEDNDLLVSVNGVEFRLVGLAGQEVALVDLGGYYSQIIIRPATQAPSTSESDLIFAHGSGDTLDAAAGDDTLLGGDGGDSLNGGVGDDLIQGGNGNDTLVDGEGADQVFGGDGDDLFLASDDTNVFVGGVGNDTLSFAGLSEGVNFSGNSSCYYGSGSCEIENFIGSDFDDFLTGDSQDNSISGGLGNDTLRGRGGYDTIDGGAGSDFIEINFQYTSHAGDDSIFATLGEGNDTLSANFTHYTGADLIITDFGVGDIITRLYGSIQEYDTSDEDGNLIVTIEGHRFVLQGLAGNTVTLITPEAGNSFLILQPSAAAVPTSLNDIIQLDSADEAFDALSGDDLILGTTGHDTIFGGLGNDTLEGHDGNDELQGSDGQDSLSGGDGTDTLSGGLGRDSISGGLGDDSIVGGDDRDELSGDEGDDTIIGGDGDDILSTGLGSDSLDGGPGHDQLFGANGGDTLSGGEGNDHLRILYTPEEAIAGSELYGNAGNDTLYGGDGADFLDGGAGDDHIIAREDDSVVGGDGEDTILGGNIVDAGAGDDHIERVSNGSTITLGSGNDTIEFGDYYNIVASATITDFSVGDTLIFIHNDRSFQSFSNVPNLSEIAEVVGDDLVVRFDAGYNGAIEFTLQGLAAQNLTTLPTVNRHGRFDVTLTILPDNPAFQEDTDDSDLIFADAANPDIEGGRGDDTLIGDDADNIISDDIGRNVLFGGGGNDIISSAAPRAYLIGGEGNDLLTASATYNHLAVLDGGAGNDTLQASAQSEILFGRDHGHDIVEQSATVDSEVLTFQNIHIDTLYSFSNLLENARQVGNDVVITTGTDSSITLGNISISDLDRDAFTFGHPPETTPVGEVNQPTSAPESVVGSNAEDTLYGGDGSDTLRGGDGDDNLYGDRGDDTVRGDAGHDSLNGGSGNDFIAGGMGDDTATGGEGDDRIFAGGSQSGNDIFVGEAGNDTIGGGDGDDFIIGGGVDEGTAGQTLSLSGPMGEDGNDIIFGGDGNDTLVGGGWRDSIDNGVYDNGEDDATSTDANQIWSGTGDDRATGAAGSDSIGGGTGDDTLIGYAGNDVFYGGRGDGADTGMNDVIIGGDGNDTIFSSGGNDSIEGGSGDDVLFNGRGIDTVDGGPGDDNLFGGPGDDLFSGGDGADLFEFFAGNGHDTITDFEIGVDILDIDETAFNFTSIADVMARASNVEQNGELGLLIETGDGDSIFLVGLTTDDIPALNIIL